VLGIGLGVTGIGAVFWVFGHIVWSHLAKLAG